MALGQSPAADRGAPVPLEPIRVALLSADDRPSRELLAEVRSKLRNLRRVVFVEDTSKPLHFDIVLMAAHVTEDDKRARLVAAMLVTDVSKRGGLSLHIGNDVETLAERLVAKLEREFFQPRRK